MQDRGGELDYPGLDGRDHAQGAPRRRRRRQVRGTTTATSKVNLLDTIDFGALFCANLVTQHSDIRGNETLERHRVVVKQRMQGQRKREREREKGREGERAGDRDSGNGRNKGVWREKERATEREGGEEIRVCVYPLSGDGVEFDPKEVLGRF